MSVNALCDSMCIGICARGGDELHPFWQLGRMRWRCPLFILTETYLRQPLRPTSDAQLGGRKSRRSVTKTEDAVVDIWDVILDIQHSTHIAYEAAVGVVLAKER